MKLDVRMPVVAAAAFAAGYFVLMISGADFAIPTALHIALKAAAVGCLAIAAAMAARNVDGWLLAAVMAFGAAGDLLIEVDMVLGGAAFALGHGIAVALYLRNRRPRRSVPFSQKAAALALLLSAPVIVLLAGPGAGPGLALYAMLLAAMAASAWVSRFSRYRTGIGAVLFLASDAFIFARVGGRIDPALAAMLIWPLYAAGQILIFVGVRNGLTRQ